jgi:hypothetical protein
MVNVDDFAAPAVGGLLGFGQGQSDRVQHAGAQFRQGNATRQVPGHGSKNIPPVENVADIFQPELGLIEWTNSSGQPSCSARSSSRVIMPLSGPT